MLAGFVIPIKQLFAPKCIAYGLGYAGISFAAKFLCGLYAKPQRDFFVVGMAMVGRGEVGLLMASQALEDHILPKEAFSITIWSILLNTFISPFLFHVAIQAKKKRDTQ